ncbi:MAG: hypothetical protein R3F62_28000 [Planctomycetota bacterium]
MPLAYFGEEAALPEDVLEIVDPGFSTADAEQVRLQFQGDLTLDFQDWREVPVRVVFREAIGFRWADEQEWVDGVRNDVTYRVQGSPWLATLARLCGEDAGAFQHLRLCFNACGVLDVVCRSFEAEVGDAPSGSAGG